MQMQMHMLFLQSHTISLSFAPVDTRHVASTHDALHLHPLTLESTVRNPCSRTIIRCTAFPSRDPTVRSHSTVTRSMFEENYHHAVYTRYATISSFTLLWYNSTKQGSCSSHLRLPRATTPPVSSNQDCTARP